MTFLDSQSNEYKSNNSFIDFSNKESYDCWYTLGKLLLLMYLPIFSFASSTLSPSFTNELVSSVIGLICLDTLGLTSNLPTNAELV